MNRVGAVWFDCDGCLVDSLTGATARPGAHALLSEIRGCGGAIVVWSAGGASHARRRMGATGLAPLVDAYLAKASRDQNGRWSRPAVRPGLAPLAFVDDQPTEMPAGAPVLSVPPFIGPDDHDRALEGIRDACLELLRAR